MMSKIESVQKTGQDKPSVKEHRSVSFISTLVRTICQPLNAFTANQLIIFTNLPVNEVREISPLPLFGNFSQI